jgi:hypothetical protein
MILILRFFSFSIVPERKLGFDGKRHLPACAQWPAEKTRKGELEFACDSKRRK